MSPLSWQIAVAFAPRISDPPVLRSGGEMEEFE
jgi:hypothetical protein